MRIPTLKGAGALFLLAASCANPIQLRTASNYYDAGMAESQQGDHYHAAVLLSRAWGHAKMGGAPDAGMAMTLYAYGRELALLGEFEEATTKLKESLRLQRNVKPPTPAEILRRVSVLARVYLDTGRAAEALPLFLEAVDLASPPDGLEVPTADYIYLLDDLEQATAASGSKEDLATIQAELSELRAQHGDIKPDFPYERFTPEAVRIRLSADLSPDQFKPQ